jgi:DivIVA domain-containing protein
VTDPREQQLVDSLLHQIDQRAARADPGDPALSELVRHRLEQSPQLLDTVIWMLIEQQQAISWQQQVIAQLQQRIATQQGDRGGRDGRRHTLFAPKLGPLSRRVGAETGPCLLTADDVSQATFARPPANRRGYNANDVDDFLDMVEETLTGRRRLTADDVRQVTFDTAPSKRAYDEDEVDEFVDRITEELDRRAR